MDKKLREDKQTLTSREREMIKLIAEGYGDQELAHQLCISLKTLKGKQDSLMQKLDLPDLSSVIDYALANGVITIYEVLESRFSKGALLRPF
jgi:two-component system response regulator NreC